jgi:hypothetical protein
LIYTANVCCRKELIYIHEKQSLLRIEIDQNLVDDIEADDVKSSINCRFSPRDVQQNIQEAAAFVKNVLKIGFVYSVSI